MFKLSIEREGVGTNGSADSCGLHMLLPRRM